MSQFVSPKTFVCVDIETTGLVPGQHEIIEIGAVKIENGVLTDEYDKLIKPIVSIPDSITHLTGISNEDVRYAPPVDEVIPSFLRFIEGYYIVGHNVTFDIGFLRRAAGVSALGNYVDNIGLARIILPRLQSYSLDNLIEFFAVNPGNRHRALDDARVTAEIYLKLLDMLEMIPDHSLGELVKVSSKTGTMLSDILATHQFERAGSVRVANLNPVHLKIPEKFDNIFGDFSEDFYLPEGTNRVNIDPESTAAVLEKEGPLAECFESYEERPGQIALTKKIAGAFNDSEILVAEAGTGTGKSAAYLIPSIMWAETNRERVIVTTNTKNLQEQLFYKDIPLLGKVMDFPFRAVILKGRGNYICLQRWKRLTDTPDKFLSKQEREYILPVASWLLDTSTGDLSETGFFSMIVESGLLDHINSESISCVGNKCEFRENCFVNRVRKAALQSHIVVANHSLVFSDMVSDGGVLGIYTRIVFDEAHNIEKTATRQLGVRINFYRIRRVLNRLFAKNERMHGLFVILMDAMEKIREVFPEKNIEFDEVSRAADLVDAVRATAQEMVKAMYLFLCSEKEFAEEGSREGTSRYYEHSPVFKAAQSEISAFEDSAETLIETITNVVNILSEIPPEHLRHKTETLLDLEKAVAEIGEFLEDFQFLRGVTGKNVFWFEFDPEKNFYSFSIESAPLDIAEKLSAGLYDTLDTIIMTSATLSVAGNFGYIRDRLGLNLHNRDRVVEFIARSPFDYRTQSALILPSFLPSPKEGDFIPETNKLIFSLAKNVKRGMLVLFTARGHLSRAYYELRDAFLAEGITLLGQGIDGSRNSILHRFKAETTSVLFGTDSFWEGVDIPGSALEIVVIVRLPFAVPTEPVIQAQMEEIENSGGKPFMDFSVPEAAIKLRQGAGRLIRHRNDRGAVIIMDTRIITARYGSIFKKCLPGTVMSLDSEEKLITSVKNWFGSDL